MDAFSDFVRKPASSQILSLLLSFPSNPPRARDFDELPSGLSLRVEDSRAAARPYNLSPILISFLRFNLF